MKQFKKLTWAVAAIVLLYSCKKEDTAVPNATFSVTEKIIETNIKEIVNINATLTAGKEVNEVWYVNGRAISISNIFSHAFDVAGTYKVYYLAANQYGSFRDSFTVKVNALIRSGGANAYVTKLFEYMPAPGQFINKAPGNLASAEGIVGKTGMVTLGAFGGYIVMGFDHSVPNKEGNDIQVLGNALAEWSEPGIIYVMQDDNGNGLPDDKWYELAGSEFDKGDAEYARSYEITYYRPDAPNKDVPWTDNKGASGFVKKNNFHTQAYYPEWITANSYTLKGAWLKGKLDLTVPAYIKSMPYAWGYADNIVGGNLVDIDNAVDDKGNKVHLKAIDFIKVQTAVLGDGGWLGEVSTEINGIKDLHYN